MSHLSDRTQLTVLFATVALTVTLSMRGSAPALLTPAEAHRYADAVLLPNFSAAVNDWILQHPRSPTHTETIDVQDLQRWQEVRQDFKELDAAMKKAGY